MRRLWWSLVAGSSAATLGFVWYHQSKQEKSTFVAQLQAQQSQQPGPLHHRHQVSISFFLDGISFPLY
jgi:uncharacterized protein YfaA (DUF2138 family)